MPTRFSSRTPWRSCRGRFADPRVGAVAGNAKVGNRVNLLTRWQALEYITSQNLDRRAFDLLELHHGRPGRGRRVAARARASRPAGSPHDTLAEDTDLTLAILRQGYDVVYEDRARRVHGGARHGPRAPEAALPLGVRHAAGGVEAA